MPTTSEPDGRVLSLLPGATEMVAALGVEPVGVSHECDYPPGVASLPAVNRCRIDPSGSPGAVDAAVSDAVEDGGVDEVDRERLAALDPDVVVTQAVCDVCAVDQVAVREAVADRGLDATVVALDVHRVADLYAAIEALGGALDREDTAAQTLDHLDPLRERPGWGDLAAVREGAVYAMDGHHHVNRAGPRLVILWRYSRVWSPVCRRSGHSRRQRSSRSRTR